MHVVITVIKKGHFRKVCRSNSNAGFPTYNCTTGITATFHQSLSHAAVHLSIQRHTLTALIDSCKSDSFMGENIAKTLKLQTAKQKLNS